MTQPRTPCQRRAPALLGSALTLGAALGTWPAQAETAYNVIAATLNALADSAPPASAADANLVRGAVKKMMDSAKADNYSVTQFAGGGPKALQSEELGAALSRLFQSIATKCGLPGATGKN